MCVTCASLAVQALARKPEFEITFAQETLPAFNNMPVKVWTKFRCIENNSEYATRDACFLSFADARGE